MLCLSPVSAAEALSLSVQPSGITMYLNLDNVYTPPIDSSDNPLGDYSVFTYTGSASYAVTGLSLTGYNTGWLRFTTDFSVTVPSGLSLKALNIEPTAIENDIGFDVSVSHPYSGTNGKTSIFLLLNNYRQLSDGRTHGLCTLNITVTITQPQTGSNLYDPPERITVTTTNTISSTTASYSDEPTDIGLVHLITTAINNGDFTNDLESMLSLLTTIKDTDLLIYQGVLSGLTNVNQFLSDILDYTTRLYYLVPDRTQMSNVMANIRTIMDDFTTFNTRWVQYTNEVIRLLGLLADMNASEASQAVAMSEQYAVIASQGADKAIAMNPPRPDFSAGDFDLNSSVDNTQRQNFTGILSIIFSNNLFLRMMLILLTCAIAGFALYGRKST